MWHFAIGGTAKTYLDALEVREKKKQNPRKIGC